MVSGSYDWDGRSAGDGGDTGDGSSVVFAAEEFSRIVDVDPYRLGPEIFRHKDIEVCLAPGMAEGPKDQWKLRDTTTGLTEVLPKK